MLKYKISVGWEIKTTATPVVFTYRLSQGRHINPPFGGFCSSGEDYHLGI